ncbi:MAG: LPS export ABC transporter permease LptG [Betaproteobacteria bacterium]|nr:LPS export ABC transporter permease LptG [Betaproteobacteria bacterium]
MRTLDRYLGRETVGATALVFAALLMLFAFFDLLHELGDVGKGNYNLGYAVLYVLLSVPGNVYELFPIAALIGAIFALAQLSAHSEFTVMRVSGVSIQRTALSLVRVGLAFVAVNFLFGEFIAPPSDRLAQQLRVRATSNVVAQEFRSGLWVKDERSFINVNQVLPDATLLGVKIFEFDEAHRLRSISFARQGEFERDNRWWLTDVVQTRFEDARVSVETIHKAEWRSVLKPDILSVLLVNPEQMSALSLYSYVRHLEENKQKTVRYEIALWTKLVYPLTVLVMMVLALPFAIYQTRTVGVGAKIFAGIMLGLSFYLVSRLSANLGAINDWPPAVSALLPTLLYLGAAMGMMWWVEKR